MHKCSHKCPASPLFPGGDRYIRESLEALDDVDVESFDAHESNMDDLEANIDAPQGEGLFLRQERHLLHENFGIRLWDKNVCYRPGAHCEPARTILAYLTLPDSTIRKHEWDDCIDMYPGQMGAPPTQHSLRRFPRAMKSLGLKPFVPLRCTIRSSTWTTFSQKVNSTVSMLLNHHRMKSF